MAQMGSETRRPLVTDTTGTTHVDVNAAVVTPSDRVRWGSILAGIFTALTILLLLTLLGIAIGLSRFDPRTPASSIGIGVGVWGAISALIAFFVGGSVAGSTAALPGHNSGMLNGMMVWIVSIPLLLSVLGGGITSLFNTVTSAVTTTAQVAAPIVGNVVDDAAVAGATAVAADPNAQATAAGAATQVQGAVAAAGTAVATQLAGVTPGEVQEAAQGVGNAAWGILGWMGAGFLAALLGGYLGARRPTVNSTTVRA